MAVAIALVIALLLARQYLPVRGWVRNALAWVDSLGAWAPVLVAAFYVVACVLLLPGGVITLASGFVLGVVVGTVTVSVGSALGVCAAFLLGRHLFRGWMERKVASRPTFAAIDDAVGEQGFKIVLLTRLNPIFPFNLQNYAYGLTKVNFWQYALASWIGMLPGTIVYVWLGSTARTLAGAGAARLPPAARYGVYAGGSVLLLVGAWYVSRVARRALRQAVAGPEEAAEEHGVPR
jgi:uncharacterized membrane protein YdjX (TVP38/TMEM64 family)